MWDDYQNKQPLIYETFKKIIKKNKISHAYLLETNGVDYGFDLALALSKAFLCPKSYTSCKNCSNCYICSNIDKGNYPDLKIIVAEKKVIKKEQLLELQESFSLKSLYGKYLIYIIKNAETLNKSSANTILKFLEEPNDNIIAILIANNIYNCLDTIVSRCQILSLKTDDNTINNNIYAKYCSGEDLNKFMENENNSILKFYSSLEEKGFDLIAFSDFSEFKDKMELLLQVGLYLYTDILNAIFDKNMLNFNENNFEIKKIISKNEVHDIIRKIDVINKFLKNSQLNVNKDLFMDNFVIEFTGGIYG